MLLNKNQIAYFGSTLNEVLNSFTISDFYSALGTPREMAEGLRNKLDAQYMSARIMFPRTLCSRAASFLF